MAEDRKNNENKKSVLRRLHYQIDLKNTPKEAIAHNDRGDEFYQLEDCSAALEAYDAALAIDPQFALAHHGRGKVFAIRPCHTFQLWQGCYGTWATSVLQ